MAQQPFGDLLRVAGQVASAAAQQADEAGAAQAAAVARTATSLLNVAGPICARLDAALDPGRELSAAEVARVQDALLAAIAILQAVLDFAQLATDLLAEVAERVPAVKALAKVMDILVDVCSELLTSLKEASKDVATSIVTIKHALFHAVEIFMQHLRIVGLPSAANILAEFAEREENVALERKQEVADAPRQEQTIVGEVAVVYKTVESASASEDDDADA